MYDIILSKTAEKEIKALPEDLQGRIIGVLERICISPYRNARRLSGSDAYRIRVGKFRIIIDINENENRIEVLRVGNRETVYR